MNAQTVERQVADVEHEKRVSLVRHRLRELYEPWEAYAPWYRWDAEISRWEDAPRGIHVATMPPLLLQLASTTKQAGGSAAGGYESRPVGHLDAVDALDYIKADAAALVGELLHAWGSTLYENLALLRERAQTLDEARFNTLYKHVRSWWVLARILSGLESRPLRPHVHCPLCNAGDSILVRLDVASKTGMAWCRECKETWDEETIGLLAATITMERSHLEANTPRHRTVLAVLSDPAYHRDH